MLSSKVLQSLLVAVVTVKGIDALVAPTEIYNGGFGSTTASNDTALRIATGGAGQSGLVKGTTSPPPLHPSTDRARSASRRLHPRQRSQRLPTLHHRLGASPHPHTPTIPTLTKTSSRSSATPPSQSRTSRPAKQTSASPTCPQPNSSPQNKASSPRKQGTTISSATTSSSPARLRTPRGSIAA